LTDEMNNRFSVQSPDSGGADMGEPLIDGQYLSDNEYVSSVPVASFGCLSLYVI